MADYESKLELLEKPNSSLFNRSLTIYSTSKAHLQSPLARSNSFRKFYNSVESVFSASNSIKGKVKKLCSIFDTAKPSTPNPDEPPSLSSNKLKSTKSFETSFRNSSILESSTLRLPGAEDRIVVYFTSLRGIRRTYEDCYAVRMIFRGFRRWVDERDISMDSAYRKELQSVLGDNNLGLPQVFIRGNYVGGAEVIKQLFETGELAKILQDFPVRESGNVCESCGGVRFVPCGNCSGSRKLFDEDEGLVKRCSNCNENGLVRCLDCPSS
ncbi:hypothetical protein UlMin_026979 [Ulmus minor]